MLNHRATIAVLLATVIAGGASAAAQETGSILDHLASPPPATREAPAIRTATLTIAAAARLADRLADDVLVLSRIAALQTRLLEVNATRAGAGATPLHLPHHICAASPLEAMCAALAHTFETGAGP